MLTKSDISQIRTAIKEETRGLTTKEDVLASERRLKLRMGKMKTDLASRIAKLALNTPTRHEFDQLKERIEGRYSS